MDGDTRPTLAVISGHYLPYRVHLHRRLRREVPEVRLASLVTKHRSGSFVNAAVPEINTVHLAAGPDEPVSGLRKLRVEAATALATRRWLSAHRPAAVLINGYDELPYIAALRWCAAHRVPAFMASDANALHDPARGLKRVVKERYVPWVLSRLSGVLLFGQRGREYFRRYGLPEHKAYTAPLEPDYSIVESMSDDEAMALTADAGLRPGSKKILSCNRLSPEKRVDLTIRAFAEIAERRPDWDLVIVGDGPLRAELEAMTPRALLDARRVVFAGFRDQRGVTAFYRRCRVLALASEFDHWGLVVNEAACAGLAIVASHVVGAVPELVHDGVNGRVVPSGDGAALATALMDVTEPGRAEAMGERSRGLIAGWRASADPVRAIRAALRDAGVIGARDAETVAGGMVAGAA